IFLGSSLEFLEASTTNVALPAMQRALAADARAMQWVVNSYMLVLGALILVGGAVGDRFGRRLVFTLGVGLFAVASVACGLAPNVPVLLAARALQGLGAALVIPVSLAIVTSTAPPGRRGLIIGTWTAAAAIVTAAGRLLGGALVDAVSWRAVFLVAVPVAIASVILTRRYVPESRADVAAGPLDLRGALLAVAGFGSVTYGLIEGSPPAFVTGLVLLAGFLAVEAQAPAPMMPLGLFRSRTFTALNVLTFLLYGALGTAMFFLPFNLVQVQGYSATATGTALLPATLVLALLSRWAGRVRDRYGDRLPLVVGPLVSALGFAGFAWAGIGGSYWTTFFPPLVVLGLGVAVTDAPLTTAVMSAHGESRAGIAAGVNNAVTRLGSLIAVAVSSVQALAVFGPALERRVAALPVPPEAARAVVAEATRLAGARVPDRVSHEQRAALEQAIDEAFLEAFRWVMLLCAATAAGAGGAALCIGVRREAPPPS
ncbi:MAG TPA: MFS transporter, partial [Thermodesulfobacteriota bacterium]